MFVDTHAHLYLMGDDVTGIVADAQAAGVSHIINVATSLRYSKDVVGIAKAFDGVYASVGIHPCDCTESWREEFEQVALLVSKANKVVAIGETGLDFYHKPFFKQRQIDAFKAHIECALSHSLPVIIHIRDSSQEVLHVLDEYKDELTGVAHSFLQHKDVADVLLEWGFYVGFGGPISYPKNGWVRDLVRDIPLDRILLETDAPFLPPQQLRGKQNRPQYIPYVAEVIAEAKKIAVDAVGQATTANAKNLFGNLL